LKKRIFLIIFFLIVATISISVYYVKTTLSTLTEEKAKAIYNTRLKEYNLILNDKKNFLASFAKFISASDNVINAYLDNNRSALIKFVMPLYKNLHPSGLLEEIHFFKKPAISFVNFANLKAFNMDVSRAREDIVWVSTSFSTSVHFYICRLYPGLRATYPIIHKDKILGSVSFGIHILTFKKLFEQLAVKDVSIFLKNENLKKFLLPDKYAFFKKLPLYHSYRVIGNVMNINLSKGYEIIHNDIYTKIPINDFFNKTIGYIVIKDSVFEMMQNLKKHAMAKIIIEFLSYLIIFTIIFMLFKWIFKKLNETNQILTLIKEQKFDEIPKKSDPKDEFDEFKNNLIDVANDIKTYISLLTQKVEKYSDKAYKDGLTEIFNRRFLEEKANELFLKYKLLSSQVGVIMMDIDNFKKINDTYGHDIGDLVLITLTQTIKKLIRKEDIFIRYGGEEFLLILPNSNIKNTYKIAEKIRKEIENTTVDIGDKHLKFTISLGISEIRHTDKTLHDAIKRADINLYKAKRNGKNRVEV